MHVRKPSFLSCYVKLLCSYFKKKSTEQWEVTRIQNTVKLCPLKILFVLQYITKLCKEAVILP